MKYLSVVAAVAAVLLAGCARAHASAGTQTLTVVNKAGVSSARLAHVEEEIVGQVGVASRWWHLPQVRFGPGGWQIVLLRGATLRPCGSDGEAAGCHFVHVQGGTPFAYVSTAGVQATGTHWTDNLDHEILEMLVDPRMDRFDAAGDLVEICDPTEGLDYLHHGVWLSDFALPTVYTAHPHGRADYLRELPVKEVEANLAFARG